MADHHIYAFSYLIIVQLLLLYFVSLILLWRPITSANAEASDQLKALQSEFDALNERVGSLELDNRNQNEEILVLKTRITNIQQKEMMMQPHDGNADVTTRQKRAARLSPETNTQQNSVSVVKLLSGPPSNCEDVHKLGHTLNGIYLAKGSPNSSKIHAIFCNFQPSSATSSSPNITEKKLGYVDIKTSTGVYFYAKAFGNASVAKNGVIHFDSEPLNVGRGMDSKSGTFTAPKAGLYAFSFSVMKKFMSTQALDVYLRLNGVKIGYASIAFGVAPVAMQSTLKLKRGDKIDLWKPVKVGELYACESYCHHFTGWLLEEDLEL